MDHKQQLRSQLRAARRAHVEALPAGIRGLILHRPPAALLARIPDDSVVGLYHATPSEAPTAGYARWLHENGRHLALPWFASREAPMRFRRWRDPYDLSDLEPDPWGTLQPTADADEVIPTVAFVPLVGFTARGERLGQGGGHYDRWLADHPDTLPIGLAWDIQLCESLPVEPHDRRLAAVVTPTRRFEDQD